MPRRPSSPPDATRLVMSMKVLVTGVAVFGNTRTRPPCCTTNQREELPGACSARIGLEKLRLVKTRSRRAPSVRGGMPARQVVLLGRASSPTTAVAGVVMFTGAESAETLAGVAPSYARTV